MSGLDYSLGDVGDVFRAALSFNARPDAISTGGSRGPETVPTDMVQSMTPVGAGDAAGDSWSGFARAAAGRLFDFALVRQAQRDGVVVPGMAAPQAAQQAAQAQAPRAGVAGLPWGTLALVGVGGLVVFLAVKAAR